MSLTEYLPHQGLTYNIHVDYIFADINFEDSNAERPKKRHTPADAFLCAKEGVTSPAPYFFMRQNIANDLSILCTVVSQARHNLLNR